MDSGRAKTLTKRLPMRAFSADFLTQAALLAIERWDRLSVQEQERFRVLARAANGESKQNLAKSDYRELRAIWKRLEVKSLISETARLLPRLRRASPNGR